VSDHRDKVWFREDNIQVDAFGHGAFFLKRATALGIALYLQRNRESMSQYTFEPEQLYTVLPEYLHGQPMEGWKIMTLLGLSAEIVRGLGPAQAAAQEHSGLFGQPRQIAQVSDELARRFDPGAATGGPTDSSSVEVKRLLGSVHTKKQAAKLGKRLPRRALRRMLRTLTRLELPEETLRLAAEVLVSGTPRAFREQAPVLIVSRLNSPVGQVAAKVLLEQPGGEAPESLRALAHALVYKDLRPLLTQVTTAGTWDQYCLQHQLPVDNPAGAGGMVALAVMSLGARELLRKHTTESIQSAFLCMHTRYWPACINNVFQVFEPGQQPLAAQYILQRLGYPYRARTSEWAMVKLRILIKFRRYLERHPHIARTLKRR